MLPKDNLRGPRQVKQLNGGIAGTVSISGQQTNLTRPTATMLFVAQKKIRNRTMTAENITLRNPISEL